MLHTGAVQHLGDSLTGGGGGDDELMTVDLAKISPDVHSIFFAVCIYSVGSGFERVRVCVFSSLLLCACARCVSVAYFVCKLNRAHAHTLSLTPSGLPFAWTTGGPSILPTDGPRQQQL